MDALQAIEERRSTRLFRAKPVRSDDLHILVELALKAPSAGNLQDYRFIVVTDKQMIKKLPDFCMDQAWISSAPAVIVVCSQPAVQKKWYGAAGDVFARQGAAAAAQNILIGATAIGLSSCWISGFDQEAIDSFFGTSGKARVEVIIPLGYPARKPEKKSEFGLNNTLFFNTYGMDISNWDKFNKNYSIIIEKKKNELIDNKEEFLSNIKIKIKDLTEKLKTQHKRLQKKALKKKKK